ncbi:MAG: hypothetical protein ACLFQK_02135 [Fibrobacterota bacterium]
MRTAILFFVCVFNILIINCSNNGSLNPSDNDTTLAGEPIGVILPLTGDGPLDIVAQQAVLEIAVEDVNEYFKENGIDFTVRAEIYDSRNIFRGIQDALSYFEEENMKLVACAGASQNVKDALHDIQSFDGLFIHSTSTAPSLSLDDNLYRFIPDDSLTSQEIAGKIWADSIKKIIILNREDVWGDSLAGRIKRAYGDLGGITDTAISYVARLLPDCLSASLDSVDARLTEILSGANSEEVGLVVLCFNEIVDILKQASSTTNLLDVSWYGSDGIVTNDLVLEDSLAGLNAAAVNLYRPVISLEENPKLERVKTAVAAKIGYAPDVSSYLTYDVFFAAAMVRAKGRAGSLDSLEQCLSDILTEDVFISGNILLDSCGDRYGCSFDFYKVSDEGSGYSWIKAEDVVYE